MVKSALVISVILSITVAASALQCYVCYDCGEIKDEYIQTCESISPPSNSTTTTVSPSNSSSSSTTSTSTTTETPSTSSSTTTNTTTTTTTEAPISNYSSTTVETFIIDRVEENYECFQGKIHVNNSDVIIRGCAVGRTNETCEAFGLSSCSFCGSDKCNSAGSMQSSAIIIISVFFFSRIIKV